MFSLEFIYFIIALALVFDFLNGFHDAANSVATIVATGALSPKWAVLWAAFFNFIAFLFFHLSVANTIGTGLISPLVVNPYLIFAALCGAITWNLVTWHFGLPSSSSHALVGGLVGAALAKGGTSVLMPIGLTKVLIAIVLSPLLGFFISWILLLVAERWTHRWADKTRMPWFKQLQFISAAALSLTHGGNDAQKTMGIIAVLLFVSNQIGPEFYVPLWVVISCNFVMGLGTLAGGWRIINTLGKKITDLNFMSGACAQGGAAATLFLATDLGIPVSTTHTITGAIAGVGMMNSTKPTQWRVVSRIVWAWIFTLPAAGIISFLIMLAGR